MKNYTSTVEAARSIEAIELMLVRSGARNISKSYDQHGQVESLLFTLKVPESPMPVAIQLPAKVGAVYEVLKKQTKNLTPNKVQQLHKQAPRTAWKLMYDWLAVQLSLIELRQVETLQVFLPFVWNGQKPFYECLKDVKFTPLLGAPKTAEAEGDAE